MYELRSLWPIVKIKKGLSQTKQSPEMHRSLKYEEVEVEAQERLSYAWIS